MMPPFNPNQQSHQATGTNSSGLSQFAPMSRPIASGGPSPPFLPSDDIPPLHQQNMPGVVSGFGLPSAAPPGFNPTSVCGAAPPAAATPAAHGAGRQRGTVAVNIMNKDKPKRTPMEGFMTTTKWGDVPFAGDVADAESDVEQALNNINGFGPQRSESNNFEPEQQQMNENAKIGDHHHQGLCGALPAGTTPTAQQARARYQSGQQEQQSIFQEQENLSMNLKLQQQQQQMMQRQQEQLDRQRQPQEPHFQQQKAHRFNAQQQQRFQFDDDQHYEDGVAPEQLIFQMQQQMMKKDKVKQELRAEEEENNGRGRGQGQKLENNMTNIKNTLNQNENQFDQFRSSQMNQNFNNFNHNGNFHKNFRMSTTSSDAAEQVHLLQQKPNQNLDPHSPPFVAHQQSLPMRQSQPFRPPQGLPRAAGPRESFGVPCEHSGPSLGSGHVGGPGKQGGVNQSPANADLMSPQLELGMRMQQEQQQQQGKGFLNGGGGPVNNQNLNNNQNQNASNRNPKNNVLNAQQFNHNNNLQLSVMPSPDYGFYGQFDGPPGGLNANFNNLRMPMNPPQIMPRPGMGNNSHNFYNNPGGGINQQQNHFSASQFYNQPNDMNQIVQGQHPHQNTTNSGENKPKKPQNPWIGGDMAVLWTDKPEKKKKHWQEGFLRMQNFNTLELFNSQLRFLEEFVFDDKQKELWDNDEEIFYGKKHAIQVLPTDESGGYCKAYYFFRDRIPKYKTTDLVGNECNMDYHPLHLPFENTCKELKAKREKDRDVYNYRNYVRPPLLPSLRKQRLLPAKNGSNSVLAGQNDVGRNLRPGGREQMTPGAAARLEWEQQHRRGGGVGARAAAGAAQRPDSKLTLPEGPQSGDAFVFLRDDDQALHQHHDDRGPPPPYFPGAGAENNYGQQGLQHYFFPNGERPDGITEASHRDIHDREFNPHMGGTECEDNCSQYMSRQRQNQWRGPAQHGGIVSPEVVGDDQQSEISSNGSNMNQHVPFAGNNPRGRKIHTRGDSAVGNRINIRSRSRSPRRRAGAELLIGGKEIEVEDFDEEEDELFHATSAEEQQKQEQEMRMRQQLQYSLQQQEQQLHMQKNNKSSFQTADKISYNDPLAREMRERADALNAKKGRGGGGRNKSKLNLNLSSMKSSPAESGSEDMMYAR
ncbi:unnamed protein product [Amoebophrya sp. A120]|nr:unnamed protein product [Amoebophrya sp. A120]|eukprot:GSA120T00020011001.1